MNNFWKVRRFVGNLFRTKAQISARAGRHLDDVMKEGEPGWGWSETGVYELFDYICIHGAVRAPPGKVSYKIIRKCVQKYNLASFYEEDYVWVGHDLEFIRRRMKEFNSKRCGISNTG